LPEPVNKITDIKLLNYCQIIETLPLYLECVQEGEKVERTK